MSGLLALLTYHSGDTVQETATATQASPSISGHSEAMQFFSSPWEGIVSECLQIGQVLGAWTSKGAAFGSGC